MASPTAWSPTTTPPGSGREHPVHTKRIGYQAPPLDGIWATAPYLHNGSVPTLHALLDSSTPPGPLHPPTVDRFLHYDTAHVGWKFTEVTTEEQASTARRSRVPGQVHRRHLSLRHGQPGTYVRRCALGGGTHGCDRVPQGALKRPGTMKTLVRVALALPGRHWRCQCGIILHAAAMA